MLKGARTVLKPRRVTTASCAYARSASTASSASRNSRNAVLAASTAVVAGTLWYNVPTIIHNDAPNVLGNVKDALETLEEKIGVKEKDTTDWLSISTDPSSGSLVSLVWGSNKTHVISPEAPSVDSVRYPVGAEFLKDVALRDLALAEQHAACVDARGDVYQWGDGFSSSSRKPTLTLRNKNITALASTPTRLFALSASGKIYVLSSSSDAQTLAPGKPTPASSPWFGTGYLWGEEETVDFAEVTPDSALSWGEKFVEMRAGMHHLLARTSSGRTFAHPLSPSANSHGQLGLRAVSLAAPTTTHPHARTATDLIPISVQKALDPELRSAPPIRLRSTSEAPKTQAPDDIRWCDKLFEVPALRGIRAVQVAAGARSSFVRTEDGRVLGWGANEFGQIGLGASMVVDTITRPTEVVLTRSMPAGTRVQCTDIVSAGDLTFFTVEREDRSDAASVEVLACGNGQWGGLGGAIYTTAQGNPTRVKNVSGLLEYSEHSGKLEPIRPHAIAASPSGHVIMTLDTLALAGPSSPSTTAAAGTPVPGRDMLVWGQNADSQLGNGKRSSLASPTGLASSAGGDGARFMLTTRKAAVNDMRGKLWKTGVEVEQCAVAGYGCSAVYWKIR